ncbi:MAG: TonB-dependent receptor, partial [Gammaproteobacteria bacterium]|nr:TonB-dependent receptor [Gammaproteobacteria bacterium]
MITRRTSLPWFTAAAALTLTAGSALAQTDAANTATPAASASEDLGEIVVTARQRKEKLVDVPVTEQVFTARDIRAAGIERPQDFIALTPGVSQVQTAEAGDMQVSIRGLNTGRDAETNFALVIDGVQQVNPNSLNQELANLQQIEIVKGPQSALYGRNAVAGAIIVKTKAPGDTFDADVNLGYGNKDTQTGNFWVSGPVNDAVSLGVSGFYRKTNGFFYNSYLHCDHCNDYYKEYGFTPRMIVKIGDHGTLDVKAKFSRISSGAINFNAVFALPYFASAFNNPDFWQNVNQHPFVYDNNVIPQNVQTNKQFSVKGDWKLDVGELTAYWAYADETNYFLTDGTSAAFILYANVPTSVGPDVCSVSVAAEPGAPLPSPTFYANQFGPGVPGFNLLGAYGPSTCDGYQYQQRDEIDNSFEIRLSSPSDQRLRWQGGLYYADINRHVVVSQGSDNGNGFSATAFVPTGGPNPTDLEYNDRFHSRVAAAFGNVAYDVLSDLEAALALRFDREQRGVDNRVGTGTAALAQTPCFNQAATCTTANEVQPYINPAYTIDPALASSGIPSRSATYSAWQPKATLTWKFHPDMSLFGSYGYGFRSGGFNSTGSAATVLDGFGGLHYVQGGAPVAAMPALPVASLGTCANGQNNAVVYDSAGVGTPTCGGTPTFANGVSDSYKKEISRAAELGFKADLFDRKLFVGASLYQTKVDNMQIFNFFAGPFGLLRVVTNIDQATLKGVEGDVRWQATSWLSLFAGIGTVDSRIDRYSGRPYTAGNKVPYAPDYTGDAGIDLHVPVSEGLALIAHVDMSAIGKTWFSPVQNNQVQSVFGVPADYSRTYRDPYQLVNARLGVQSDHWSA